MDVDARRGIARFGHSRWGVIVEGAVPPEPPAGILGATMTVAPTLDGDLTGQRTLSGKVATQHALDARMEVTS